MSTHDFIPNEVFENLPEDPAEQFQILLQTARDRYQEVVANQTGESHDATTIAFMSQIQVIAEELGFGHVPIALSAPVVVGEWTRFESALSAIMTKIRLRGNKTAPASSVALGRVAKFHIEQEIEKLRELIDRADLSEKKKRSLNTKLDELIEELHRQRLSFAKLAAVTAAVAGVLGGSSATLANAPEAIEVIGRIMKWVGEEKAAEEEEQLRLAAPPKALPAPSAAAAEADE